MIMRGGERREVRGVVWNRYMYYTDFNFLIWNIAPFCMITFKNVQYFFNRSVLCVKLFHPLMVIEIFEGREITATQSRKKIQKCYELFN